ncbi:hypothetical protein SU69_04575 [Thermosipho melanesiensis]|uniref:Type II secretion system protein n=2 Tax=Thermosipho melanesiensis TaxID=46541 RepID=A6LLF6_THEM4|nr:hypothetical protein [Thermosipho melanesiensis]ABR30757.1 hypothetical protein Tmel_0896 [Thermosipho melanesiensis BI429]APT73880.1 hypothetical protein BW47_04810 [Thermosipho melanesiensis]OOC35821.1 hypothetical protein SU68_04630 [Thermosipho melanesiensis]OOC38323.1 hypothetical protein SU69_04575 [Thermosipho melanesiensis]OOC38784.1 hypothetical protein SU70_04575 [Thermosipho melanesiensis]
MKKGSLLVEVLITLTIIVFAFSIAFVPSWNLVKKTKENSQLIKMSEILLNKCEEYSYQNVSSIIPGTFNEYYDGENYKIVISKNSTKTQENFNVYSGYDEIIYPVITIVSVRVEKDGKYIEAQVVPQQW